jgi:hypothetical protein
LFPLLISIILINHTRNLAQPRSKTKTNIYTIQYIMQEQYQSTNLCNKSREKSLNHRCTIFGRAPILRPVQKTWFYWTYPKPNHTILKISKTICFKKLTGRFLLRIKFGYHKPNIGVGNRFSTKPKTVWD